MYFRVLYGRETLVEPVICLKRLITIAFGSLESFSKRVMSAPSLYRESTNPLIYIYSLQMFAWRFVLHLKVLHKSMSVLGLHSVVQMYSGIQ